MLEVSSVRAATASAHRYAECGRAICRWLLLRMLLFLCSCYKTACKRLRFCMRFRFYKETSTLAASHAQCRVRGKYTLSMLAANASERRGSSSCFSCGTLFETRATREAANSPAQNAPVDSRIVVDPARPQVLCPPAFGVPVRACGSRAHA